MHTLVQQRLHLFYLHTRTDISNTRLSCIHLSNDGRYNPRLTSHAKGDSAHSRQCKNARQYTRNVRATFLCCDVLIRHPGRYIHCVIAGQCHTIKQRLRGWANYAGCRSGLEEV